MPQTDLEQLVFSMEANVNKLVKNMQTAEQTVEGAAKKMEVRLKSAEEYMGKLFGKTNVGEALEKTFSRARFGVLEEGGAKIGVFGSALEALGPAGLTAAAGLAAVGGALEMAKSAAEYAEEIQNTADKLGVTTKALQQYNFVAIASGVSTDAMKEALQSGNEVLGAFQSNIGAQRVKSVFAALGISPEEARKASSIIDLLPEIADKIKGLGSAAEQSKVAEKLGLSAILPVLQKGKEGVEELKNEAVSAGVVLDTDMIAKGKEAAEEFKKVSDEVSINMKRAFIDLAPLIEKCVGLIAAMARGVADTIEGLGGIKNMSTTAAQDAKNDSQLKMQAWAKLSGGKVDQGGNLVGGRKFETWMYNQAKSGSDQADARINYNTLADKAAESKTHIGTAKELAPDKVKKGPADQTEDFDKTALDDADDGAKAVASAMAALTKNIEDHAQFEKDAIDEESTKKLTDLAAEEVKIRQSKNDAHKADQLALIEAAKADTLTAAAAKKDAIDQAAMEARAKADLEFSQQQETYQDQIMTSQASMARTAQQRAKLELQVFRDTQSRQRESQRQKDQSLVDSHQMTPDEMKTDMSGLGASQNADLVAKRDQDLRPANPLYSYTHPENQPDQMQTFEVTALDQMNDGLVKGLENWKTMGSAAKGVLQEITQDLLKMAVEKSITMPLASALWHVQSPAVGDINQTGGNVAVGAIGAGGAGMMGAAANGVGGWLSSLWGGAHAAGGTLAAGKIGITGEKGPELTIGGAAGTEVVPNDMLKALQSLGSGTPVGGGGGQNLTVHNHYELTGAVSEQAVQGWIANGDQRTLSQAASAFRSSFGAQLSSYSALEN